ncbi:hypothetical protein HPB51_010774 [Rhipicephalus microplus]|uniref:Uncharacterized protein n=1 Tax=Rhipicephalus microplus TaxID=6941 RepID=A0A9J6DV13_RHIMP|nr:hypothetical protein HPB51_010774 [Rhipicephalus microplus]
MSRDAGGRGSIWLGAAVIREAHAVLGTRTLPGAPTTKTAAQNFLFRPDESRAAADAVDAHLRYAAPPPRKLLASGPLSLSLSNAREGGPTPSHNGIGQIVGYLGRLVPFLLFTCEAGSLASIRRAQRKTGARERCLTKLPSSPCGCQRSRRDGQAVEASFRSTRKSVRSYKRVKRTNKMTTLPYGFLLRGIACSRAFTL